MDEQNNKHVPTAEEIARLEAQAAAALRQKEAGSQCEAGDGDSTGRPAFVPYVDDVPEPAPAPVPQADAAAEDDDDDEEYIPSEWEKRIDRLTPRQWKLWQLAGGAVVGLGSVASLFVFGQELATYGIIVAVLLTLLLPRYLERAWRRSLNTARYAMLGAMVLGLAIMALVIGLPTGFNFRAAP